MNTSEKLITIIKRLNFDTKISCENPFLLFIYRIKIIDVYNCSFSLPLDIDGSRSNCYNEHCRTDNIRQINKKLTACFLFLHMSRSSFNKTLMYTKDVKLTRNVLDRQYVCLNMFTFLTWHSIRGENIIIFYSR